MNNIARHARVDQARVSLAITPAALRLEVSDAGGGIPDDYKAGIGLAGMRERAALIGGTLEIGNVNPNGTRVVLTAPIRQTSGGQENG
jgi:signal transduction histidine kinase